jgi:hypothetical protein
MQDAGARRFPKGLIGHSYSGRSRSKASGGQRTSPGDEAADGLVELRDDALAAPPSHGPRRPEKVEGRALWLMRHSVAPGAGSPW